jgi:hypothetical protein
MQVSVRYGTQTYPLQLPANPSVSRLQNEVRRTVAIPPAKQRLIFKGKVLSKKKDKLSAYGIVNTSKILLVANNSDGRDDLPPRRPRRTERGSANMDLPPHIEVIDRGPPPGCLEGMKTASHVLPKTPFVVYNTAGDIARLSVESDAFWIEADSGENERVFFTDLKDLAFLDLKGYPDRYAVMILKLQSSQRVLYFIPKQYMRLIEGICRQ